MNRLLGFFGMVLLVCFQARADISVYGTANQATVYAHVYDGTAWRHIALSQTASGSGVYTVVDSTIDDSVTADCRSVGGLETGFPVIVNNSSTDQTAVFLDGPKVGLLDWDGTSERLPTSFTQVNSVLTAVNDVPTNSELATALDPLPTANENRDAVWGATMTSFNSSGSMGQVLNWQKASFVSSGVFSEPALENAASGGGFSGGGVSFVAYVGTFDPNAKIFDVVQGEERTLTIAVQATPGFADPTPTEITATFKDTEGTTIVVEDDDITRVCQDASFQIIRLTLPAAETATLATGALRMQISFDNEKVQASNSIRIVESF